MVNMKREVAIHLNLKQLMESTRVSLKEVSSKTGIPQSTLSTYVSGKKASYDPTHLMKLSEHFGVSVDHLFFNVNQHNGKQNPIIEHEDEINAGLFKVVLRRKK
jgi:transcriptional regulator with XRE-family HTH domain